MSAKVQLVSQLHNKAMEYTDESFIARGLNERDEYLRLTKLAYEKEAEAANLLFDEDIEPTRSILHRSAATLAFRCEMYPEAKRLVHRALSGNPSADIELELNDLLGKVKLALAGVFLEASQVQLTLEGSDIAFGKAPIISVLSSIRNIRDLIQISANFDVPVYFESVGASSFYVNLTVGKFKQAALPGFDDTDNIISTFLDNLKLLDDGAYESLQNRIDDPNDYRGFVKAAKGLAPDGHAISSVNVQAKVGDNVQSVFLTKSRDELSSVPIPDIPEHKVSYVVTDSTVKQKGVLKVADAREKSECVLVSERWRPWAVEVPAEYMNEVLGDFFNKYVEVTGRRMKLSRVVRRLRLEKTRDIRLLSGVPK